MLCPRTRVPHHTREQGMRDSVTLDTGQGHALLKATYSSGDYSALIATTELPGSHSSPLGEPKYSLIGHTCSLEPSRGQTNYAAKGL